MVKVKQELITVDDDKENTVSASKHRVIKKHLEMRSQGRRVQIAGPSHHTPNVDIRQPLRKRARTDSLQFPDDNGEAVQSIRTCWNQLTRLCSEYGYHLLVNEKPFNRSNIVIAKKTSFPINTPEQMRKCESQKLRLLYPRMAELLVTAQVQRVDPPRHVLPPPRPVPTHTYSFSTNSPLMTSLNNDKLLMELCSKLIFDNESYPATYVDQFNSYKTYDDQKNYVLTYIHYLQTASNPSGLLAYERTCQLFDKCFDKFRYRPSEYVLNKKRDEWNGKCENVVGSVHIIKFKEALGCKKYCCLAVVDQKIVSWTAEKTLGIAFSKLFRNLILCVKWDKNYKFTLPEIVPKAFTGLFVNADSQELYKGNKNVVSWFHSNFSHLSTGVFGDHIAALPALYNLLQFHKETQLHIQQQQQQVKHTIRNQHEAVLTETKPCVHDNVETKPQI